MSKNIRPKLRIYKIDTRCLLYESAFGRLKCSDKFFSAIRTNFYPAIRTNFYPDKFLSRNSGQIYIQTFQTNNFEAQTMNFILA
jgi:hypothetical protein